MTRTLSLFVVLLGASLAEAAVWTARPAASAARDVMTKVDRVNRAIAEREHILRDLDGPVTPPPVSGSSSGCVANLKGRIGSMMGQFVDQSRADGGSFDDWFSTPLPNGDYPWYFPGWTVTTLTSRASVPLDVLKRTPWGATAILGDEYGIDACVKLLQPLSWLGIRWVNQSNTVEIREGFANEWFSSYDDDSYTRHCDGSVVSEPVHTSSGEVTLSPGALPPMSVVTTFTTSGSAVWKVEGNAFYSRSESTRSEDYTCYFCPTGRHVVVETVQVNESASGYRRNTRTTSSDLYAQAPRYAQGTMDVYGAYSFEEIAPQEVGSSVRTGCQTKYCTYDEMDDQGNVTGQVTEPCGKEDVYEDVTVTIPGWRPDYERRTHKVSATLAKRRGENIAVGRASEANSVILPEDVITIRSEVYTCSDDNESDGFAILCRGRLGWSSSECMAEALLPTRELYFETRVGLLKLELDYP